MAESFRFCDEDPEIKKILQKMPKIELHAHLNGSISRSTMHKLIALKQKDGSTQFDLKFMLSSASSLSDCFRLFKVIHEITDTPEAIRIATIDVINDFYNDSVRYLEIRSTPREVCGCMNFSQYVQSVLSAIEECKISLPAMTVKLILSINRTNSVSAAEETVKIARENFSVGGDIVGIDLSGNPLEGDVSPLFPILQSAKNSGLKLSLHMAETPNTSEEVTELLKLIPDRIGHGTFLHPLKGGSQSNFNILQQLKIPLEICLTSNVISATVPSYAEHHFPLWHKMDYPCVLCTDDKGIFDTSLSDEYFLAAQHYSFNHENLWDLSLASIDHTFLDQNSKNALYCSFLQEKGHLFPKLNIV